MAVEHAFRGAPEPLTAPSSWAGPFSLSADGRRLVFADRNIDSQIVRAPFDRARRELAAPPEHAFSGSFELREQKLSPHGEWILFVNEDPPQQLHLVRRDGTGYRQLTTQGERNRQGEWSPRADRIVFQTQSGESSLATVRPDGGGWQPLPFGVGVATPRWSPDGNLISAFDNSRGGLLLDLRGGLAAPPRIDLPPVARRRPLLADRLVARRHAPRRPRHPRRPDREHRRPLDRHRRLRRAAAHERRARRLQHDVRRRRDLAYTDDQALWLRNVDGGEPKRLYAPPRGHRVGNISSIRDGRWLTWIEKADESDIWLMTLDDGVPDGRRRAVESRSQRGGPVRRNLIWSRDSNLEHGGGPRR